VCLPPLTQNHFFNNLYTGLSSHDELDKRQSTNYFNNIRNYNSSFAMISSEAKIDESVAQGIYHFKIHDAFYHRAGPLTATDGRAPKYAQLYFYDVDTANSYRSAQSSNQNCNVNLLHQISVQLNEVNPFVQSFHTMKDFCEREPNIHKDVSMFITVNRGVDLRRYNDAVATDVAVIFSTVDGEPPFERNMISFNKSTGTIYNVSVLDSSLDPLAYPLLFPNGDTGWHVNMKHNIASTSRANVQRSKVTMLQYVAYRLAIRDEFSLLHHSKKLFLQWIVDVYVRVEGTRLHFIRENQATLRSELYNNLTDHMALNDNNNVQIGRRVILPSSFIGSPRNMYQNYLDAMAIVQHFGKPSLFVTMTCNPHWPEIVNNIDVGEVSNFRPEIVVRVFKSKLKELIHSIVSKEIFGKVVAIIYTIEFQKRGLPHAHILITLHENDRIVNVEDIDRVVCAEIPNMITHPMLYECVVRNMMHGPCGLLNPNAVCMKDGKCAKDFPKPFNAATHQSVNGYPLYKRQDNGISADVRGKSLDNRYVVPYNPYLLAKFNCHINVEVCTTVRSVKYIYKYVYKGYDSATIELCDRNDEIHNFLNGRYVGSTEAMWRIYEIPMHYQSHAIYRLDIHLPHQQTVYFRTGEESQAAQNVKKTKLLAFFELNILDDRASSYTYVQIPMHYTWNDRDKNWTWRLRGGDKIIPRMYLVSSKDVELFHLRLLLLHVKGPKSFADVRTYNGIVYSTFVEACYARGIATNDNEWRDCLNEAKVLETPKQMRQLFGFICALNVPANSLDLWNEFKVFLSEDFLMEFNERIAFNRALLEIEEVLLPHNLSCEKLGMPAPFLIHNMIEELNFDPHEEQLMFDDLYQRANIEQRDIIDRVMREVIHHDTESNVYCLTAHAGCGKTFVQTAIIHRLRAMNLTCIATAFSGIASTLLIDGKTLHNVFKLPIPLLDTSVSNVTPNSAQGQYINSASLILIDEISMCPLQVLKIIDDLLRDLCTNEMDKKKTFGGKPVLLCGDFRQILPVVPHGSRATLIENCVTSWDRFLTFQHVTLTQNMRVLPNELEFVEFLKQIGNNETPNFPQYGDSIIEIPQHLIGNHNRIIEEIYGDIELNGESDRVLRSIILATTNEDCAIINQDVLDRIQGEEKTYLSTDKVICDDDQEASNYPVEFLNSLNVSGLPSHKLTLKVNCIVLLIRNLNTSYSLVNGTRLRIRVLHNNVIDCEVLTGTSIGLRVLIPRINLTFSGTILPFKFQRTQFPVITAFAMTINKSQGQTFDKVGIFLRQPVFTHGQLYVAASRVRTFQDLTFFICEHSQQGHLGHDDRVFTKNIVFPELLHP